MADSIGPHSFYLAAGSLSANVKNATDIDKRKRNFVA